MSFLNCTDPLRHMPLSTIENKPSFYVIFAPPLYVQQRQTTVLGKAEKKKRRKKNYRSWRNSRDREKGKMSFGKLVSGAECSTSANPLSQLHRSFDRDTSGHAGPNVGSGSSRVAMGPGASGMRTQGHGQVMNEGHTHAQQFFGSNNNQRNWGEVENFEEAFRSGSRPAPGPMLQTRPPATGHIHAEPSAQGNSAWAQDFMMQMPGSQASARSDFAQNEAMNHMTAPIGSGMGYMRAEYDDMNRRFHTMALPVSQYSNYNTAAPSLEIAETQQQMNGGTQQSNNTAWETEFLRHENITAEPKVEDKPDNIVLEEVQGVPEEPPVPKIHDSDELARTAKQLLENVEYDQSDKFRNSNFLKLMAKLRDREVTIEDDRFVETVSPATPEIPLGEDQQVAYQ